MKKPAAAEVQLKQLLRIVANPELDLLVGHAQDEWADGVIFNESDRAYLAASVKHLLDECIMRRRGMTVCFVPGVEALH